MKGFVSLVFSAKPQEYKARHEKRHEAKNEVLGHSKQAEFVRLMEEEVKWQNSEHHAFTLNRNVRKHQYNSLSLKFISA